MSDREPIKVIADIIQQEMELADGAVMLSNQKLNLPNNGDLRIVLSYVYRKAIGAKSEAVSIEDGGMTEIQSASMFALIQIDIFAYNIPSGGNLARQRADEVILALNSIYAEQKAEENIMQFQRIPTQMIDASDLEGSRMVTRYTGNISVLYAFSKEKTIASNDYYDKFPTTSKPEPEVIIQ